MMSRTDEDFELELRSLPGVLNVALTHRDDGDVEAVTLVVYGKNSNETEGVALQIASLYYPEAKVIVRDADASVNPASVDGQSRVVLVRAEFDASDGSCVVELGHGGRIGVGRTGNGPLIGGAEATMAALRDLGYEIPFSLISVTNVTALKHWPVIVTLRAHADGNDRFGIAQAEDDVLSAAKATLDALNRYSLRAA